MPILVELPPLSTDRVLRLGLENIGVTLNYRGWGDGLPSFPLQLYTANLQDIASGKLATTRFAWRYPIDVDDRLAFADMTYSNDPQFKALSKGGIGSSVPDALRAAYLFADGAKQKFRVRILDIPGIYSYSIWLHGRDEDWFCHVTLGDAAPQVVSREEFFEDVSHRASLVLGQAAPHDERTDGDDLPDPFKR